MKITKTNCDAMEPGETINDSEIVGLRARKLPSGRVTFDYRYRIHGERKSVTFGLLGTITADEARRLAQKRAGEVADGRDPGAERAAKRAVDTNTVDAVLDKFRKQYLPNIKTGEAVARDLARLVSPMIGSVPIYAVTRRQINDVLVHVAENNGGVTANRVLAYVRKMFNWYAVKDEKFNSPIVKGMTPHRESPRERLLDDDELRYLVAAADALSEEGAAPACYAAVVRALLFSTQRRGNVATAHSDEIKGTDWVIRIKDPKRPEGRKHLVPITHELECEFGNRRGFLFSTDGGKTPFQGYGKVKMQHDRKIAALRKAAGLRPMAHWTYHDLRRTGRTKLGNHTTSDIAERIIGHVIGGVRGVYDLNEYKPQKREALEKLAAEYNGIFPRPHSPASNVVALSGRPSAARPGRRVIGR